MFEDFQNQDKLVPEMLKAIAEEWKPVLNTSPDKYYGNKEFFDNLNKLCRKIRNWENAKINQSNIGKFAEKYMKFLKDATTERRCVDYLIARAEAQG